MANPKFDMWKDGIDKAVGNPKWNEYDCDIQVAVGEFNRHLLDMAGYKPLDWKLIKSMIWVETGAANPKWRSNPMQIGVLSDPGLGDLLADDKGGEIILPPTIRQVLNRANATTIPHYNFRAGIGYLLMKAANFTFRTIPDADTAIYEVKVKQGDSFDRIAREQGSTIEILQSLNPTLRVLHPGQTVKYRKAAIRKVVSNWDPITPNTIPALYNGGGDLLYQQKLNYVFPLLQKGADVVCAP